MRDLGCQELVELVTAYLDGALAVGDRERFEAHLAECDACVVYVHQIEETIRLARASAAELEEAPAVQALLPLFRDWAGQSPGAA